MIETVNAAMLEMQAALLARSLYPAEHPRIREGEERATELVASNLDTLPELTVFAVDGRVVAGQDPLPSSETLCEHLFRRLRARGVDRLTFRRGLATEDVRALLDALAQTGEAELPTSPRLALGYLDLDRARALVPVRRAVESTDLAVSETSEALAETWTSLGEGAILDADTLGDVITSISHALQHSAGAMLPLAPLKVHDEYTFVHTINVAILSTALAESVGFTGRDVHDLNLAALLHDVGKRVIPIELLNKTGRFTDEEFKIVQLHPVEGARILLSTPGVPELAPIVAYEHHVRADGSGYPKLPKGWRLSLASRVVQVADVFDALRTHRPYRPALPLPEIHRIMRADAGPFFDDDLLDAFFERVVSRGVPEPADLPQ